MVQSEPVCGPGFASRLQPVKNVFNWGVYLFERVFKKLHFYLIFVPAIIYCPYEVLA